jgi:competence protein ComEC
MLKRNALFIILLFLCLTRLYMVCHMSAEEEARFCIFEEGGGADQYQHKYRKYQAYDSEDSEDISIFLKIRRRAVANVQSYLPSPHSELLSGLLLGQDNLYLVPRFNDVLRSTGTIHVVVVSGFNISLVFGLVISVIGSQYKLRNLLVAEIVTLFYALIAGFEPPVIRAWIMGSIAAWGKYYGRSLESFRLLILSAVLMILINPEYLISLSFQLSFLATLSLIKYSPLVSGFFGRYLRFKGFLIEDLSTTVAAQILVWPLISYRFGQVSILSPLVNGLILWTVPMSTVMGGMLLLLTFLSPLLAFIFSMVVFVPLDIFIGVVSFFGKLSYASVVYQISLKAMAAYYLFVFIFLPRTVGQPKRP